jgi:hypothetical protein
VIAEPTGVNRLMFQRGIDCVGPGRIVRRIDWAVIAIGTVSWNLSIASQLLDDPQPTGATIPLLISDRLTCPAMMPLRCMASGSVNLRPVWYRFHIFRCSRSLNPAASQTGFYSCSSECSKSGICRTQKSEGNRFSMKKQLRLRSNLEAFAMG